jgi:hypothetical protein
LLVEAEDWMREEDVPEGAANALERSKAALAGGEARTGRVLSAR